MYTKDGGKSVWTMDVDSQASTELHTVSYLKETYVEQIKVLIQNKVPANALYCQLLYIFNPVKI